MNRVKIGNNLKTAWGHAGWILLSLLWMGMAQGHAQERGDGSGAIQIRDVRLVGGMTVPIQGWIGGTVELTFAPSHPSDVRDLVLDIGFTNRADMRTGGIRVPVQVAGAGRWRFPFLVPVTGAQMPGSGLHLRILDPQERTPVSEMYPVTRHDPGSGQHVAYIGTSLRSYFLPAGALRTTDPETHERTIRTSGTATRAVDLPRHFSGYSGVTALVWHHPDLEGLEAAQRDALAGYIRQGGHLVLVSSLHGRATDSDVFPPMPAVWSDAIGRVSLAEEVAFRSMPGYVEPAGAGRGLSTAPLEAVPARGMEEVRGRVLLEIDGHPILVRGQYGGGTVTMVAVDIGVVPLLDTVEGVALLSRALELPLHPAQLAALHGISARERGGDNRSWQWREERDPTAVMLTSFRDAFEMRPLRPLWVFLFTMIYATCAGPILYYELRKKKRLGKTALYLAGCGILFTIVIYLVAFWIKGGAVETMEFGIVDVSPDGQGSQRTIGTLFAVRPGYTRLDAGEEAVIGALEASSIHHRRWTYGGMEQPLVMDSSSWYHPFREGMTPQSIRLRQWSLSSFSIHRPVQDLVPLPELEITIEEVKDKGTGNVSHPVAQIRRTGDEVLSLPGALLVTAEGFFVLPSTERSSLREMNQKGIPLSAGVASALQRRRSSIFEGAGQMPDWREAVRISFPRLAGEYARIGEQHERIPTLENLVRHVSPEKPQPGSILTPWQILATNTDVEDVFEFDLTRILCEGGGVLLRIEATPPGLLRAEGLLPVRRGYTIRRDVIPPERIRRGGGDSDNSDASKDS